MSLDKLVSYDRKEFVLKIFDEINHYIMANAPRNNYKDLFGSLVDKNKSLLEDEKIYCKEKSIYNFEFVNALYKIGIPVKCNKCNSIRYSDRFCENCIGLYLQGLHDSWTSGNKIVDEFIRRCQKISSLPNLIMEWIPFEQFTDVRTLTSGGFSTIYIATWKRGCIEDYNENTRKVTYFGIQEVVLKSLNNSNELGSEFFDQVC